MKCFWLISLILSITLTSQVSSFEVACRYEIETGFNELIPAAYCCNVISDHHHVKEGILSISSATGRHLVDKKDTDVTGFWVYGSHFDFFPQGLSKVFNNLEVIIFGDCGIKRIGKNDLKPFPKLIWFSLFVNQIEVIENGLFDYNPNLKYISLRDNKISRIHPNSFDHLAYLVTLRLSGNLCINVNANENRNQVVDLIRKLKAKCSAPEVITTTEESINVMEGRFDDENIKGMTSRLESSVLMVTVAAVLWICIQ
ncbi:unnamed protein product [Chironomus riparius]|uniref:Uncharacterized protein n=1 Tax=Chironomus riparius TaxID=315576 RepID=A0A9N9S7N1_9DIPT|nr:unnamed protein product [Chironomus riparius]